MAAGNFGIERRKGVPVRPPCTSGMTAPGLARRGETGNACMFPYCQRRANLSPWGCGLPEPGMVIRSPGMAKQRRISYLRLGSPRSASRPDRGAFVGLEGPGRSVGRSGRGQGNSFEKL